MARSISPAIAVNMDSPTATIPGTHKFFVRTQLRIKAMFSSDRSKLSSSQRKLRDDAQLAEIRRQTLPPKAISPVSREESPRFNEMQTFHDQLEAIRVNRRDMQQHRLSANIDKAIQALPQELQDIILEFVIAVEPAKDGAYHIDEDYKPPIGLQLNHKMRTAVALENYAGATYQLAHIKFSDWSVLRTMHPPQREYWTYMSTYKHQGYNTWAFRLLTGWMAVLEPSILGHDPDHSPRAQRVIPDISMWLSRHHPQ